MEQEVRLIDANKLKNHYAWWEGGTAEMTLAEAKRNFDVIIDVQPTVDAEPVVRCKDCKYMTEHYDTDGNVPYWTCSEWDSGTDFDGYCYYGERKEDAEMH